MEYNHYLQPPRTNKENPNTTAAHSKITSNKNSVEKILERIRMENKRGRNRKHS